MTLINLFEIENPNEEQQIVLDMINTNTHSIQTKDLPDETLHVLQEKGFLIDFVADDDIISTDYDPSKIDIRHLMEFTDKLVCNNIPNVARVRNYILATNFRNLSATLIQIEKELKTSIYSNVKKDDIPDFDLFKAVLEKMNKEVVTEYKHHYRIKYKE